MLKQVVTARAIDLNQPLQASRSIDCRPENVDQGVAALRRFINRPVIIESATFGGMGSRTFVEGIVNNVRCGKTTDGEKLVVVSVKVLKDLGSTVPHAQGEVINEGLSLAPDWSWQIRSDTCRVFKPQERWEGRTKILLGTNIAEPSESI